MSYPIPHDRLMHMIGVAEYMHDNANRYCQDSEKAYFIGLLHDIGYISGTAEGHEQYGALLLRQCGVPETICNMISLHGKSIVEIEDAMPVVPLMLVLLLEADLSVDLNGNNVGFDKRLEDIKLRHGIESKAYKQSRETMQWLYKNMK